jgi:hypothetical protein
MNIWGGGGGGHDKVRPMSQLGNIHLCRYLVLIPILDTLVWFKEILTTKIPALDFVLWDVIKTYKSSL